MHGQGWLESFFCHDYLLYVEKNLRRIRKDPMIRYYKGGQNSNGHRKALFSYSITLHKAISMQIRRLTAKSILKIRMSLFTFLT